MRERLPYRLNAVVTALRDFSRETDARLEDIIVEVITSLEDDGVIDENESQTILISTTRAMRTNTSALNVLNLLDESGSEAALREVERLQARSSARAKRR